MPLHIPHPAHSLLNRIYVKIPYPIKKHTRLQ